MQLVYLRHRLPMPPLVPPLVPRLRPMGALLVALMAGRRGGERESGKGEAGGTEAGLWIPPRERGGLGGQFFGTRALREAAR